MKVIEKWIPVKDSGSNYKFIVWCPDCRLRIGIIGHEIDLVGSLSPSLVCPHEGCNFHEFVQLKDYPKL